MIDLLLPISKKKIEVLKYIYEQQPTHLRKIAVELKIHPYLVKKIIDSLVKHKILEQQKAGKTILLKLNKLINGIEQVCYLIESFKQKSDNKTLQQIIKNLQQHFAKNQDILTCVLFGSYARNAQTKESDVDVLFVIKNKNIQSDIAKKVSQLGLLWQTNFSPIFMTQEEFQKTLKIKEPTIISILIPSQRIILFGIEHFLLMTQE